MVVSGEDARDQIKIDRVFAALDSSLSLIDTVIEYTAQFQNTGTATGSQVIFPNFTSTVDFANLGGEYRECRIKAIKFDVYDTAPNSAGTAYFATQHYAEGQTPATTLAAVTASLDSGIVPPGDGKHTWTWVAKGTRELAFFGVNGTLPDYGGLVAYFPAATGTTGRYQVIARAHVQFRARI